MTLCRTFTSSTLLALSLVVCAGVSLPGCGDKGGYRGGKKTKARQVQSRIKSLEKLDRVAARVEQQPEVPLAQRLTPEMSSS